MRKMLSSILFIFLFGCEYEFIAGTYPDEMEGNIWVELDPRLLEDGNGYYHLEIDPNNWQTLHRLSGIAYQDGEPLEVLKVRWESSHWWYLGDTLGYIVSIGLTDDLEYVSYDTSYVTGFNGFEVPTVNCCSYSNADGEVNTMFAPVQSMVGDTVAIRMYFFNEWNFEYDWEIFYIVLD